MITRRHDSDEWIDGGPAPEVPRGRDVEARDAMIARGRAVRRTPEAPAGLATVCDALRRAGHKALAESVAAVFDASRASPETDTERAVTQRADTRERSR